LKRAFVDFESFTFYLETIESDKMSTRIFTFLPTLSEMCWAVFFSALTYAYTAFGTITFYGYWLSGLAAEYTVLVIQCYSALCSYLELSQFDVIALVIGCVIIYYTSFVLAVLLKRAQHIYDRVEFVVVNSWLDLRGESKPDLVHIHNLKFDYTDRSVVSNESHHSSRPLSLFKEGVMPDFTVQLFHKVEGELSFVGHATHIKHDGRSVYVTSLHNVLGPNFLLEDPSIIEAGMQTAYVGTLQHRKALPVSLAFYNTEYDVAVYNAGSTASILGVKATTCAFPSTGLVTIPTFNPETNCYAKNLVATEPVDRESPFTAAVLETKSSTNGGDSGIGVFQQGKLVAIHKGSCDLRRTNIHVIPVPLLRNEIRAYAAKFSSVLIRSGVKNETPTSSGSMQDAVERAREIEELDEEERERRMLGTHQDEQGFRTMSRRIDVGVVKTHRKPDSLRGNMSWADYDNETKMPGVGNGKAPAGAKRNHAAQKPQVENGSTSMAVLTSKKEGSQLLDPTVSAEPAPNQGATQSRLSSPTASSTSSTSTIRKTGTGSTQTEPLMLSAQLNMLSTTSSTTQLSTEDLETLQKQLRDALAQVGRLVANVKQPVTKKRSETKSRNSTSRQKEVPLNVTAIATTSKGQKKQDTAQTAPSSAPPTENSPDTPQQ
jgi:hypothetical protein